ncbi:MAG: peptidoglycan DD-metalloendopeptidase family protein [Bacteroidales bacterium]|nr:peptidoglycan DD-metalloendopeptidase family protein [Bacteroidales bacterium]
MRWFIIIFIVNTCFCSVKGQTRTELERKRNEALKDIEYLDNMLEKTSMEKSESMNELNMIRRKLSLRENIINGLMEEQELLEGRMELNKLAIELMENDVIILMKEYEKAIKHAQKVNKGNPELAYILSAKDINQGYKRLKYLQQVAKYRRREAEIIIELKNEVEENREKLEKDLIEISELKQREERQKNNLNREQRSQRDIISSLSRKERELKKELDDKRRIANEIEKEIARIIEEERRRSAMNEMTPEEALIGEDFAKNIGRLPWPVERGVITSQFGVHDHPVIKGAKINNIGVEITSGTRETARAVFKGRVMSVFGISGGNMAVIIRHGKYLTVYQNLVNVKVRPGDEVEAKEYIGDVYYEGEGKSIIKFMVYEEREKKDPEEWLAKK